jgi:RNA polymerase sigma-70 factor (ECF subfamily)
VSTIASTFVTILDAAPTQDELYQDAAKAYGAPLERLARAYEADPEIRRDLLQEIHMALWRSFESFDGRCSPRTWTYRVAHNIAASHVMRQRRTRSQALVGLEDEELENLPDATSSQQAADRSQALDRLLNLIQRLKPLDRHVILSYLEGLDAASIREITGLSPGNVATKIHRIKTVLARQFQQGDPTMNNLPNNPQQIWQCQPVEGIKMSVEALRHRSGKFETRIRRRNVREYVASVLAAAGFGYFFVTTHALLFRVAYVLFIVGLGWVVFQLHRKASARTMPSAIGATTSLQFFRSELERQRDAVQNAWPWYLAPLVPGFVILTAAYIRALPYPAGVAGAARLDGVVAVLFFLVWKMNQRAARRLQRVIDELHAAENSRRNDV